MAEECGNMENYQLEQHLVIFYSQLLDLSDKSPSLMCSAVYTIYVK